MTEGEYQSVVEQEVLTTQKMWRGFIHEISVNLTTQLQRHSFVKSVQCKESEENLRPYDYQVAHCNVKGQNRNN
jgi:hypothetical protein